MSIFLSHYNQLDKSLVVGNEGDAAGFVDHRHGAWDGVEQGLNRLGVVRPPSGDDHASGNLASCAVPEERILGPPGTRVNRLISGAHLLDVEDLTSAFKLFAHHHPPAGRISCDHLWIVHTPLPFV